MKKTVFSLLAATAMLAAPAGAFALEDTPSAAVQAHKNQAIIDSDGHVLGKIYEVNAAHGYVTFMSDMHIYRLPLASLSTDGNRLKTTLTRAQIGL